jgi:hypothetical protein
VKPQWQSIHQDEMVAKHPPEKHDAKDEAWGLNTHSVVGEPTRGGAPVGGSTCTQQRLSEGEPKKGLNAHSAAHA